MPTGLGIRDFFKEYREVQYSNSGSIRLSEIEHNAYVNRLTVEITHYDAPRANNYKTLPENTHWGYLTAFKGSSVLTNTPIKFVKQRVYDHINQGIWQYHQSTEDFRLLNVSSVVIGNEIVNRVLDESTPLPGFQTLLTSVEDFEDEAGPVFQWLFEIRPEDDPEGPQESEPYTAFPVASPYPDVWKFQTDIPASFLFRLESWYLVNPVVYIVANPTDTGDATEGEDEYPKPDPGDGNGDGGEFPPADELDPESDPRDGDPQAANGTGIWNVRIKLSNPGSNSACDTVPPFLLQLRGFPRNPPQKEYTGPPKESTGGRPGRFFTSVDQQTFNGDCEWNVDSIPAFFSDNDGA